MRALAGFLMGTSVAVAMTGCAAAVAALTLPADSTVPTVTQWAVFVWWLPGLAGGLFGASAGLWLDERQQTKQPTPSPTKSIRPPRPLVQLASPPRRTNRKAALQPTEQRA